MREYAKIKKQMESLKRYDVDSPQFAEISTWCSNRITWAWKFKKISRAEMEELCDNMVNILEGNY